MMNFFSIVFYVRDKPAPKFSEKSYEGNMGKFFFVQKKTSLGAMRDIPLKGKSSLLQISSNASIEGYPGWNEPTGRL